MNGETSTSSKIWKEPVQLWLSLVIVSALLGFIYFDGLELMVKWWNNREEYGHGFIIPFITLFLIWQKKDQIETIKFENSWLGVVLVSVGLILFYAGELSSIYTIIQYSFLLSLYGIVLSMTGMKTFKIILVPLIILFFMIPLPNFIFFNLSSQLQLISSQIGVAVIRLFDISVFLEGNVIDLGVFKLQVVEACSGLNYLFPLMTLAFISAYFFTGAFWKKAIIFLSSIPITILMNSFRIGVIGIMVEYWGIEMAEGFLHDFEGWAVFMSCIGILIIEMWILAKIGKDKLPLIEAFGLDFPEPAPADAKIVYRETPKSFYASLVIVTLVAISVFVLPEREEIIPERKHYAEFPLEFNGWSGSKVVMEQNIIDVLKFSDYAENNYLGKEDSYVTFYSTYYDSQKKGASAHSPRACIPGDGWRISSLEDHNIPDVNIANVPLVVNRLLIEKG
ncbi:MAG: VPLPA-CTERM-specific exosortase XrtD, partial [Thiotrichaceae bacterium]|nr:VPLPA-CTERM-specific exosortase XrtD [Thiotrichaceae bacterium]